MKELTKKCIGLISKSLVELGQTKSDKDILILSTTLAEDLSRDWKTLKWEDVEESFRTGIRTSEKFVLNVQTYYSWLRAQKKLIDKDTWAKHNQEYHTERKELKYRKKNGTGLLSIQDVVKHPDDLAIEDVDKAIQKLIK